jgi:hypothetical protein
MMAAKISPLPVILAGREPRGSIVRSAMTGVGKKPKQYTRIVVGYSHTWLVLEF